MTTVSSGGAIYSLVSLVSHMYAQVVKQQANLTTAYAGTSDVVVWDMVIARRKP